MSKTIEIKGAREHNLKNIDVSIPRNKLVVVTGVSGSGKSSLVFDTLFAEGQRMYVESLSSYARQFLGRMQKPDVDYISGLSPAIAIEQKVSQKNPRSTVGTMTEIYDYLKLFFTHLGKTFSPISGEEVKKQTTSDVVDFIKKQAEGSKIYILSPYLCDENRSSEQNLSTTLAKGFSRIESDGELISISEAIENKTIITQNSFILIDRIVKKEITEDVLFRLSDSIESAFFEGKGRCVIRVNEKIYDFSNRFERDGLLFEEPTAHLFTFNNSFGACKRCEGFGNAISIDSDLVFPDKNLSLYEGAIAPWRSDRWNDWLQPLFQRSKISIHRPINQLTEEEIKLLWSGNSYFQGLDSFFQFIENESNHKIQYRVLLSRYRGKTICPECKGTRLRKDANYVKVNEKSISDLVLMTVSEVFHFFSILEIPSHQKKMGERLLTEIQTRLRYLVEVGVGYLTLNRLSSTLSGGEFQRIKLSTALGSALVGSMYILDEPSIGLHPRDTQQLVDVLKNLRDLGNTVIVVEHEEEVIRAADELIDIGPEAGKNGGKLIFQGDWNTITAQKKLTESHTLNYLNNLDQIKIPTSRRKPLGFIEIVNANENNLKAVTVKIPLGVMTCVTGVSGSGKSTLIKKILYPALMKQLGFFTKDETGKYKELRGDYKSIKAVEVVGQESVGKSSRSNPVTYLKIYDAIRLLMSDQPLAKQRGYTPAVFSFNVEGGRCEVCEGEGEITIEMQFMADVHLTCDSCKGKRFKQEILEVSYKEKNIFEILDLTVDEAIIFFENSKGNIDAKLKPLQQVGLGYISLGQSSNTLSGGESQRMKLAYFLSKNNANPGKTLFIFDEPTTGLHFHDIHKLSKAFQALTEQGDTVIIIEHNVELIKLADYIIDIGPEGGEKGGYISFTGTPEDLIKLENNHTAKFLKQKMING